MNSAQNLRNRAIRVLYLIFLSLVFFYIPADFLPGTKDANQTLEDFLEDHSSLHSFYERLSLAKAQDGKVVDYSALRGAEQSYALLIRADSTIETLKNLITAPITKGNYGTAQRVHANIITTQKDKRLKLQLDSIIHSVQSYFPQLGDSINRSWSWDTNYTFLELSPSQFSEFYFTEAPAAAVMVNLTSFIYRHRSLSSYLISQAVQTALPNSGQPQNQRKLIVSETDTVVSETYLANLKKGNLFESVQIREGRRHQIEAAIKQAVVYRGETIAFNNTSQDAGTFFIRIKRNNKPIDSAYVNDPYSFTVEKTGKYLFEIIQDNYTKEFNYECIERPASKIEYLAAYPEMTFSLNSYLPDLFDPTKHTIDLVNAHFYSSNDKHYLKLSQNEGYAHVIIKDNTGVEQILEKRFIVRKPDFELALNNTKDGDYITTNLLSKAKYVNLSFDSFFNQESIFLQSFDVQIVIDKNRVLSKPLRNQGNLLSPPVKNLFQQVKSGDQIIFKNIRCITSRGLTLKLNSTILTVE